MLLLTVQLDRLGKIGESLWKQLQPLFTEHHFITVICGFFVLLITISCYRFLKSISPALVGLVLLLMLFVLILHWTQTRTEPLFLKGFVDGLAPFLPAPAYPIPPKS